MKYQCFILIQVLWLSGVSCTNSSEVPDKIFEHKPYRYLGCFKDELSQRAMGKKLGQWETITICAEEAWKRGYEVFGVQNGGECWSSKNASFTYGIYGNASGCTNGTGGEMDNDVYAFLSCPAGHINTNTVNPCQPCPVNTYKENNVSCQKCVRSAKTWGRLGVDKSNGCTDENPIKVSSIHIKILPQVQPVRTIVTFNASYHNGSLVIPPLRYSINSITKQNIYSRDGDVVSFSKDATSEDFDSCLQLGNLSYPFCIHTKNGSIMSNKNFSCIEGDQFMLNINVSDSAEEYKGIISNSNGSVTVKCTDSCMVVRPLYTKANNTCSTCQSIHAKKNVNFTNNGSSEMQPKWSWTMYDLYAVYLIKSEGKMLSNPCFLEITYEASNGKSLSSVTNPKFDFGINDTIKSIILEKPLRLTVRVFTLALICSNNTNGLSNISSVSFTVMPQRSINCATTNETCLKSLYKWKIKSASTDCKEDPSKLMDCYGHCMEKPDIRGPRHWRGTSGQDVLFHCNVTSIMPFQIEWLKDGSKVGSGQTLLVRANTTNQGEYLCKVTNIFRSWSRTSLFVLTDYFTSYVKIKLNKKYQRSRGTLNNCTNECRRLAKSLVKYTTGPCRKTMINWDGNIGVECTLYGEKQSQKLDEYYDTLITALKDKVRTENIQEFSVRDAEFCLQENTGTPDLRGVLKWNSTRTTDKQSLPCPYGPIVKTATRHCNGKFKTGATWKDPNDDNCNAKPTNTGALDKLNKTKVDSENAKEVAQNLSKIFKKSSSKNLTGEDASLAANLLEDIVSFTEKLNETAGLVLEVIGTVMEMDEAVLGSRADATSKIIKVLDKVAENIPIEEGKTSKVLTTGNLVLQANKVNKNSFKGLNFGVKNDGSVTSTAEESTVSVELPSSVLEHSTQESSRVGFIYYGNNKLFQSQLEGGDTTKLSEHILSSSVYNTKTSSLSNAVKLTIPRPIGKDGKSLRNSSCVYWDEQGRKWLRDGCTLCKEGLKSVQCCCDHMTSFAVLFSPQASVVPQEKTGHAKVLSIITYVGCGISLLGVLLTFLTYLLFRHLRKTNQQPILMNICAAIGFLLIVFVAGINSTTYTLGCQIVAVLLHYLTLVTVLWMGIEAYNLYLQIVKVMAIYQRKFMLKAAMVGWGLPLLIVLVTLAAAIIQYKQSSDSIEFYYGSKEVCILHNHLYRIIGWFSPVLAILVLNFVIFFVVVRKLNSTGAMTPVETKSAQRKRCWTAFAILWLLGLTWLFGALAISDAKIVFEYLFCIFNSLQGFFIFFFHCVRIPEVRKQWSFFVSGLGFSHKDSEPSRPRSRGIGESQHSTQENGRVRGKSFTPSDKDAPRKGTMLTTADDQKNGNFYHDAKKVEIELDNVNHHSNYAVDESC